MGSDRLNWHVITGPPCSGQSATIDALAARGFRVRREIARNYIEEELRKGRTLAELRCDISSFQLEILQRAIESEAGQPFDQLFLDRAVPDSLSYFRLHSLPTTNYYKLVPKAPRYGKVFIMRPVPDYQLDYARAESLQERNALFDLLWEIYERTGAEVHEVPVMSVEERVSFILRCLD